ncbi:hypothetical protein V6x_51530 [Gimesia chilikensis]|uniref:DUF4062 domain-containing protein n=1 Tax=Gimesia chilikensis TaxID=2605989 RepID=A0A517WJI5_9PLAN|nr:DUF4062 domain-containing protein [Gimesia chilikensis]QDU05416.1 hypothetical protein V6x_51530 [Gimesia chilikensis]
MIPNIFISSTIKDLHHLRDILRDTIIDLAYNPVMSEHGGVGYLNPVTAAESCYISVNQCQMMVLIIGSRYGWKDEDGLSVTHREFKTARDARIPIITLVESRILNYKDVYDANRESNIWDDFDLMDDPRSVFELLDEISNLESFNAIVEFKTPEDARKTLKLQLAHFVGDRLSGKIPSMGENVRDILAEITTLRSQLTETTPELKAKEAESRKYLAASRFLLRDENAAYAHLINFLTDRSEHPSRAEHFITNSRSLDELAKHLGYSLEVSTPEVTRELLANQPKGKERLIYNSGGKVLVFANHRIVINPGLIERYNNIQMKLWETVNKTS